MRQTRAAASSWLSYSISTNFLILLPLALLLWTKDATARGRHQIVLLQLRLRPHPKPSNALSYYSRRLYNEAGNAVHPVMRMVA